MQNSIKGNEDQRIRKINTQMWYYISLFVGEEKLSFIYFPSK